MDGSGGGSHDCEHSCTSLDASSGGSRREQTIPRRRPSPGRPVFFHCHRQCFFFRAPERLATCDVRPSWAPPLLFGWTGLRVGVGADSGIFSMYQSALLTVSPADGTAARLRATCVHAAVGTGRGGAFGGSANGGVGVVPQLSTAGSASSCPLGRWDWRASVVGSGGLIASHPVTSSWSRSSYR